MIVADANLIMYLLVDGERTRLAEAALARDMDWRVPALWRSEVLNALLQHLRTDRLPLPQAFIAIDRAQQMLAGAEEQVDPRHVIELALTSGRSAYDCEYVAVAENLGTRVVTSDRALLRAFPTLTVALEDFTEEPS